MDARNQLVSQIGKIMYNEDKKTLVTTYHILTMIVDYIDAEPAVEKDKLLSLLRNITSNIILVHGYRD